jgi:copper transport protein
VRDRGRIGFALAAVALALVLPAAASAHAYLVKTSPAASVTLNGPPQSVALTFDEAVEPRFAIVSVTDVDARQQALAPPSRSPADPDTLVVPIKRVPEGWYLVYWRAISVDGHPVQGGFTFAVGPNPGPAPQFRIPHVAQTATSTSLVLARWVMFLTVMTAIGLLVLLLLIAQPVVRRVEGTRLRAVSIAFWIAAALGLVAIPVYLEQSTAIDSLRSFFDVAALVPLWRTTAFGRGYLDMEICFALFCGAAGVALWLDRPERERRSVASLLAITGALAAAGATLLIPGAAGHAAQTSPRGVSLMLDWLHLASGSIWIGGLIGLLVLWRSLPSARRVAGLAVCVPRFSNVALGSVLVLLGSGIGATVIHLPVADALWLTSYGKAILVKIGILAAAMALASVNLFRNKPRLARATADSAAGLLRGLVGAETILVAGAIFVAALLSSLAPPPPAFAKEGQALTRVGPGKVAAAVTTNGYRLQLLVDPNRAAAPNSFALRITRGGKPVRNAQVMLGFAMLDMVMPNQNYVLTEKQPGVYVREAPALVMVGHWALSFTITPAGKAPFAATIVDHATG